mmetsp:Transcript_16597/g.47797  ORF Transcript_16597/g.47797 Transcript_16597/m.47797 type:complete len:287 (-) Transcript_16597:276-1136(-)
MLSTPLLPASAQACRGHQSTRENFLQYPGEQAPSSYTWLDRPSWCRDGCSVKVGTMKTIHHHRISPKSDHKCSPYCSGGAPQRLNSITLAGNRGYCLPVHLESRPRHKLVLEIDNDIGLILVLALGGLDVLHFEVLINIGTLLGDGLLEDVLEERLRLTGNVRNITGLLINEESGCVTLAIFASLNGAVLRVQVETRRGDDPVQRMGEVHQEGEAVGALAPEFAERGKAVGKFFHFRKAERCELGVNLFDATTEREGRFSGSLQKRARHGSPSNSGSVGEEISPRG